MDGVFMAPKDGKAVGLETARELAIDVLLELGRDECAGFLILPFEAKQRNCACARSMPWAFHMVRSTRPNLYYRSLPKRSLFFLFTTSDIQGR